MRIRNLLLAVAALVAPGLASAQTVGTLDVSLRPSTVGPNNCGNTITITIKATNNGLPVTGLEGSDNWEIRVGTNSTCSEGEALNKRVTAASDNNGTYEVTATADQLFDLADIECSEAADGTKIYVCVTWDNQAGVDDETDSATLTVDRNGPERPRLLDVTPGERQLHLHFEPADDESPDEWEVCFRAVGAAASGLGEEPGTFGVGGEGGEAGADGAGGSGGEGGTAGAAGTGGEGGTAGAGGAGGTGGEGGTAGAGGTGGEGGTAGAGGTGGTGGEGGSGGTTPTICETGTVRSGISGSRRRYTLGGLTNGVTYQVAVRAIDESGNPSEPSAIREGTPVEVDDFWELYRKLGGLEDGGCSSATGLSGAGLTIAALLLARRRSGRR